MEERLLTPRAPLIRRVHRFCGAILSLVLIVIALTGTLLVFKDDYVRATLPDIRLSLETDDLARVTEAAEARFGAAELRALVYASDERSWHKAYLRDGAAAYLGGDGRVVELWAANGRAEDWVFDLHHRLLGGTVGLWIAGLSGLAGTGLVLTGLIAVWPMRRGFRRGLKVTTFGDGQLRSLHRNLGTVLALPLVAMLLSGSALTFPQTTRALFDRLGGPDAAPAGSVSPGDMDWRVVLKTAQATFPDAAPRMAIWPGRPDRPAMIRLKQPAEWHPNGRTVVGFDPSNNEAILSFDALSVGRGRESFNAIYPLHAAHVGGRTYDVAIALLGTGLTVLGGLGLWTYVRRWRPAPARLRSSRRRTS